jgi:hypothetical protein
MPGPTFQTLINNYEGFITNIEGIISDFNEHVQQLNAYYGSPGTYSMDQLKDIIRYLVTAWEAFQDKSQYIDTGITQMKTLIEAPSYVFIF